VIIPSMMGAAIGFSTGAGVRGLCRPASSIPAVVGLMNMEDENGMDAEVVLSPVGPATRAVFGLTAGERAGSTVFERNKRWESGKFSRAPGRICNTDLTAV
jgi:hypothetical protein